MNSISIKQVCETIWNIEKEEDLLNWEIENVKIWQLLRFEIFMILSQKVGLYEQAHSKTKLSRKIRLLPLFLMNSLYKSPFKDRYEKKILVFDHPRKVKDGEKYLDIYTDDLLKEMDDEQVNVIESDYLGSHYNKHEKNRRYLDSLKLSIKVKRPFTKCKLNDSDVLLIEKVERNIEKYLKVKVKLKDFIIAGVKKYKIEYNYYNKLFKKRKPQKIYLVVSYRKGALIAAAKADNIETVEIQHGVINKYHLGYNFPFFSGYIEYFPNKLLLFGEYWKKTISFPIHKNNIQVRGFPYLNNKIKNYNSNNKKKQILFISQGTIGRELIEFAYKVASECKEYNVLFKLHPGEDEAKYKFINHNIALKNFNVIINEKKELYSYFSESEYQVGVYSTALYEGLVFDCKTILINLPGIEYMEDLISNKFVHKVSNIEEFKSLLSGNSNKEVYSDFKNQIFFT
ncbi:hypothetical protein [Paraliobacillus sediminis]|uniref:hypothetical protein n=1 Tax=Paraliobacillus sediminis TaxID=1885916 RepID=UPI000E3E5262|nr:hypothetical protein [Paraliobacillus sediminis]